MNFSQSAELSVVLLPKPVTHTATGTKSILGSQEYAASMTSAAQRTLGRELDHALTPTSVRVNSWDLISLRSCECSLGELIQRVVTLIGVAI